MNKCTITWLGHACFKLEFDDYKIVIDPFKDDYVPGCAPIREKANLVLCSHAHGDHNYAEAVEIEEKDHSLVSVTIIHTYHDDQKGTLRGENKIHILDNGSLRIAHLGDLGCELEEDQKQTLSDMDVLLIPVGGYYTINALQAKKLIDEINPKVVIPMHYRGEGFGFDVIGTVNEYTDLCDDVVLYDDNKIEITKNTKKQTAVLKMR